MIRNKPQLKAKEMVSFAFLFLVSIQLCACASYQFQVRDAIGLIRDNKPTEAATKLKEKAEKPNDDQVVYLFEYATALQLAGDYEGSNKAFLQSEELTDIKDYHSLSRVTGSILLNQGMIQYKGEDYEKVLINAYLAINFLMQNNFDGAMVETRKINEKLYRYKFEAKREYEQNPFAFYLAALLHEANRSWDDAYIDYKNTYKINPTIPYLKEDLLRMAQKAQRPEELEKWRKEFPEVKVRPEWKDKKTGELVLVYQQGWGPKKFPHPDFHRVPKLYPVRSETVQAKLVIEGGPEEISQSVYSVEDVAIKILDDTYAELIATRMAGIAAKAVVSDQIRQKNELLGNLAWIGMNIADQADLRQWSTLPQTFQVARVLLKEGKYKAKVIGLNSLGAPTGEESASFDIEIKPQKKSFLNWRSLK